MKKPSDQKLADVAAYLEAEAARIGNEGGHTPSPYIKRLIEDLSSAAGTLRRHVHVRQLQIPYNFQLGTGVNWMSTCQHGQYSNLCPQCNQFGASS